MDLSWAAPSPHLLCPLSWVQLDLWSEFFSLHIMLWVVSGWENLCGKNQSL